MFVLTQSISSKNPRGWTNGQKPVVSVKVSPDGILTCPECATLIPCETAGNTRCSACGQLINAQF